MENVISVWARRWHHVAAVALCASAVAVPFGVAGASVPKKLSLSYYVSHPCSLITRSQIQSVFGLPMAPGKSDAAASHCSYIPTKGLGTTNESLDSVSYEFQSGTAASEKQFLQGQGPFVNEASVGHGAFCQVTPGVLYVNVGTLDGSLERLNIATNCPDAAKFARDALARLS